MTDNHLPTQDWSTKKRRALTASEVVTQLSQIAGWQLSGDGADLNRWPFAAERQPRTDADSTGQDFHPEDADPAHAHDA